MKDETTRIIGEREPQLYQIVIENLNKWMDVNGFTRSELSDTVFRREMS